MQTLGWIWSVLALAVPLTLASDAGLDVVLTGDWEIEVRPTPTSNSTQPILTRPTRLQVPRPVTLEVVAERHESLPLFNPNAGGWVKGAQLRDVRAQETTTPFLLDSSSLVLRSGPASEAEIFKPGADYEADLIWGTLGRKTGGRIGEAQPVYVRYRYTPLRLDAVVLTSGGEVVLRPGDPSAAAPHTGRVTPGERHLANLWLPGPIAKLGAEHLFPIHEAAYPESPQPNPTQAEARLPRTLDRLRRGETVRILAWGDSVTDGGYLPNPGRDRWQEQFVARLQRRFLKAKIALTTEAWGGRNTGSYLAEPPGSPHHYRERVLGPQPHLVVSEFVNDAGLTPAQVAERYGRFLADFRGIEAEWIILTPHYVRPDWMGLDREREIDEDPRPYVAGLREFAARQNVALADASRRYGRLWRQGIPYTTLLLNSINHPDARGMRLFADALMELFPDDTDSGAR